MAEDFQETMETSVVQEGDIVTGKVISVDDKKVSVDIGYKYEGIIPIRELSVLHIEHPNQVVQEGDEVRAVVLKTDDEAGIVVLSKREAEAAGAWERLQALYDSQEAFDVVIQDVVKGGLVTDVGVRGFIPASLVDWQFVENLDDFKGKTVRVRVVEIDPENNKLILSRKAVLEDERREHEQEILQRLTPGVLVEGTVQRLTNFGAFVDIGGVDGLVHISEIAWHHIDHPSDVLKEGDPVRVKILKVDPDAGKVSLSIKEATPSPWETAVDDLRPGQVVTGTVRRLTDFGAFVEIKPGLEGLVHVSQIAHQHVATPSDVLEEGQTVEVKILGIEPERRRISLSIKEAAPDRPRERSSGGRNDVQKYFEKQDNSGGTGATLGDLFGDLFRR
ncbi:30S ribosomal protein S1 [Alicyclobacillus cycloheptanicus]|uniref:Small subunit ribosomal protein S1 n=1 Tax=Alicyclobacillus cycloheptanicus TaxID=1457 RepID=A0ABT9XDV8_9BACL|nr:30S ribosomal protein S1 [Alicyclobacillus cycloheptanicus]MDQ0188485.1 small subunit ribosomal protein S1 [Alicyclobacillus cycloheptanicus]WDM01174.1 30S ribosomal protein S1 [Alicyclobacillus cycloheptanicus]